MTDTPSPRWIAIGNAVSENEYAVVRTVFEANQTTAPELLISVDSDFAAFLNGVFLGRGQFSDFPDRKTFTRIPLKGICRNGKNELEIRTYYCGSDFLTHIAGTPRLWGEVRDGATVLTATGKDWKVAMASGFTQGKIEKINNLLGYTWQYDARKTELTFHDAKELDFSDVPTERPVPMLFPGEPIPAEVVQYGYIKRMESAGFPGQAVMTDLIRHVMNPFRDSFGELPEWADGIMAVYDLGRESTGLLHLELEASAGTVVDIAHGEHLGAGRVQCCNEDLGRTYTDRYICKEGHNDFTFFFRRYGCRYLELHVTNMQRMIQVEKCTLLPLELPLPEPAAFRVPDRLLEKTHAIGARTLTLCMHEHYEDCPWREQALYGYDSRNQMLFGYYVYGNYDFAAASLSLLGYSMQANGFLTLTAPGYLGRSFIPIFTFAWLAALREFELYSGSRTPFLEHRERIRQAIPRFTARPAGNGLYLPPVPKPGIRCWNFCEWVDGLDGSFPAGTADPDFDTPTAFYNLYLVEALRAVAALDRDKVLQQQADALGRAIEQYFWSEPDSAYRTRHDDSRLHTHIQYHMLSMGLVPEERRERVIRTALSSRCIQPTFSSYLYMIRALAAAGRDAELDAKIREDFDRMTLAGATSFWEYTSEKRGFSRSYNSSLCHGWSCAGLYWDGAYRLGITPLEPGFSTFALQIHPAGLQQMAGDVPTPHGPIRVEWKLRDDGTIDAKLQYPAGTRPGFIAPDIQLI